MVEHLRKPQQNDFFLAAHRHLMDATSAVRAAVSDFSSSSGRRSSDMFEPALVSASPRVGLSASRMILPTLLIKFLKLWPEGHHEEMQDLLREQPDNKKQINLIDDVLQLLVELTRDLQSMRAMGPDTFGLLTACLDFLLEAVQGKAEANKLFIVDEDQSMNALHQVRRGPEGSVGQSAVIT